VAEHRIAVAYSGGRDSTALLHATLHQAAAQHVRVVALHVHHGLSPKADEWLVHCEAQCSAWAKRGWPIEFSSRRLEGKPGRGESVEAWARDARYLALRQMAESRGAAIVLLAHHRRDQAETFLLQALRGAGLDGLSGMARSIERDGICWQRPWLDRPRSEIDAYVRRHRLKHIEDESNLESRYAHNRLRLEVWPALESAFAQAEGSLATSAQWMQEASDALAELAAIDLLQVADEDALKVDAWLTLSAPRRSNVLRAWLRRQLGMSAPASLVRRLLEELVRSRAGRWPAGSSELRLSRNRLRLKRLSADADRDLARETRLSVRRAGTYALPGWSGSLEVKRVREYGVPLAWLAHLELRRRVGAEQFQAGLDRPPRSLKKQYQAAGVAMWDRNGPLIFSGDQLIFVPGLGLDARVIGLVGQPLVSLQWLAQPA
jgi:tRNA(Ile)-lysidine synthase